MKPLGGVPRSKPRVYSLIEHFTKQAINAGFQALRHDVDPSNACDGIRRLRRRRHVQAQ